MRLRRLDLARYGKFTDRTIDFGEPVEGEPDLHIIYGPNEAGKSTAFAGFLDLLFGIEAQSRYGFLHPYPTMRVGGCLDLAGGPRELVRIKRRQQSLLDGANQPVPEGIILGDLGGLDRSAYRTMFSLDDETLEAGGRSILASNGELGQLLFSASAGLSELSEILLALRSEAEKFARSHARGTELQQLKADITALKDERSALDTLASEYNRLAAARESASAQYDEALAEQARVRAALAGVRRLLQALPPMMALRELRNRLEGFAEIPDPPPGWRAELPGLEQEENRQRSDLDLAEAEVKRLSAELEAVRVDDAALTLVGRLDRLTELRARHVTADLDLPARRQELAGIHGEVASMLRRLGRDGEPDPSALLMTSAQSAALNRLILARSGIEVKVANARDELSEAMHELTEARHAQAASGSASAFSLTPIASVLAALRDSDHSVRLRGAAKARVQHVGLLATRLAGLAPWAGSVEELAALDLPDPADVQVWQTAAERDDRLLDRLNDELQQLEGELERRKSEREAIGAVVGLLSDQEAAEIRRFREAAWAEHRRRLDADTADSFEAALRRDDIVGNARLGHERDLAKLHEIAQAVAVKHAEVEHARVLRDEAAAQCRRGAERIAQASAPLGVELSSDMSPARLLSWMALRNKALETQDLVQQAERSAQEADADAAALHARLSAALGQAGISFDPSASLDALAAAGQAAVDDERRTQALRQAVADYERAARKREVALERVAQADKAWLAAWRDACRACWLGEAAAALPFEAVRDMLQAATALEPVLRAERGLTDRIRCMEADQAAFGLELERLAPVLGLDHGQQSRLDLAQTLTDRVRQASDDRDARRRLQDQLSMAQDRHRQVTAAARAHGRRLDEMKSFMGASSLIDLAGRLRDAEQKRDWEREAVRAEREILAILNVESLADAQVLLEAHGAPELEVEEAGLVAQLEALEPRTRELFAARSTAADRIVAIGGDDAAARLEERRRTKLLEVEDKAGRYLRLCAGIAAADRALRAYRDQHRSSMMQQASEVFRVISRGVYRGLGTQPDKGGDILVALGADGGSKLATDLSKGTRFQLYLALRAAGYLEFAKSRRPIPFVADDIMETFDDFRAEETLRVFKDMARVGQVIYLTHHAHLRGMAERSIPGVRIHELAA